MKDFATAESFDFQLWLEIWWPHMAYMAAAAALSLVALLIAKAYAARAEKEAMK